MPLNLRVQLCQASNELLESRTQLFKQAGSSKFVLLCQASATPYSVLSDCSREVHPDSTGVDDVVDCFLVMCLFTKIKLNRNYQARS